MSMYIVCYHISKEQPISRNNTRLERLDDGAHGVFSDAVPCPSIPR